VLQHLLPVEAGKSPETLRGHTLKAGEQVRNTAVKPAPAASTATVTVDSTFIRSCHDGERHLEVRVGNVETPGGARQVFGAVARTDTDLAVLIRRNLEMMGRTDDTKLTAFTDGCPGLRAILADAGVTNPGVSRKWGITPPLPVVGLGSILAQTGGRVPTRARRCRPHSEPGAEDRHLFATIASVETCSCAD